MVMATGRGNVAGNRHDGPGSIPYPEATESQQSTSSQLSETERSQLRAWNATEQEYPRDRCVPELVARQAAATPDAVALVADGHAITYAELNRRANQLAHHLRGLGVGPDVLVAVCLERSLALVVGMLGVLKAGGAYVPLDPAYPPQRLAFMLEDTHAPVLVTHEPHAARLPVHRAQAVCLDRDAATLARCPTADPAPAATAEQLAYVIYTSGSTGQPKGVQISHANLLNLVCWHQRAFAVTRADRATQVAGPGFDATGWELWPYLTAGASVYLPDEETRVTPERLRDWLVAHQISITFLPTALAERALTLAWPRETALRYLLTGADTLHLYPSAEVPFTLVNNYGPTETTVVATSGPVPPLPPATAATAATRTTERDALPSIGRPIANTEVYLLDEELRPVPLGAVGELYLGGASLSRGYLHRPELTAERFIPHPFSAAPGARLYRTGDLVRFLPDGQLAFLGRADTQIKIRGYRIEPDEIVAVLQAHPAVQASVVTAREEMAGDKQLVAYVVLTPGAAVGVTALQDHLRTCLPDYMIPASFVRLEAMPLTPNGKLDRAALPAPDPTNTLRDAADAESEPHTMIAQRVAEIVATLLRVEGVGLDDNFFLLGGHSMLGTQVIAQLADTFGVEISLRTLFDGPTVRALSTQVEQAILAKLDLVSSEEIQHQRA